MNCPLLRRRDLDFMLHEWLAVAVDRVTVDQLLDLAERVASRYFAPHNRRNDVEEPRFEDGTVQLHPEVGPALRAFYDAGFATAGMAASVGGMELPSPVCQALMAWFHAANVATTSYAALSIASANLLLAHGSPEMVDQYVPQLLDGRFFGTMCLTEPQAGSSLGDITTRATPQQNDSYRVTGSKMWISAGDHELGDNIVHLVLAKVPGGPTGAKGISLLLVPKFLADGRRNTVAAVGVNHKLGWRGTSNVGLTFDGAVGYLVGEQHRGLSYMFHMMNEARLGIGLSATALGYAGYLGSLDYAQGRRQGRTGSDPAAPQVPIIDHPDVRRMLLAQKAYVEGALALNLYCGTLLDKGEEELLDILTPLAKSWASQWCLEANSLAIQVLGGYGYSRDYPMEQLYRDNRLNAIHEGTHGIQALDLLGRKLRAQESSEVLSKAVLGSCVDAPEPFASQLRQAVDRLNEASRAVREAGDAALALANATPFMEAAGHTVIAWMWLEQLKVALRKDGDFYEGKRRAAEYFFRWELPKTVAPLDIVQTLDRTPHDMATPWF